MKKIIKWLSLALIFGVGLTLVSCDKDKSSSAANSSAEESSSNISESSAVSSTQIEIVDYVSQLKLDESAENTSIRSKATVHFYVDGDTTHFNMDTSVFPDGILKARFLAVDTPESTGQIEKWGKTASLFTKAKLSSATSIIVESDTATWNKDSTSERYLVFVWYRTSEDSDYRNLNLELLQEGLSKAKNTSSNKYGDICTLASIQAREACLKLYGDEKDENWYEGDAQVVSLSEIRNNIDTYNQTKVCFEAMVTRIDGNTAYVQDYDVETETWYGMQIFMGFTSYDMIQIGNVVRFTGTLTYYEAGGVYQVSSLTYYAMKPSYIDNLKLISTDNEIEFTEITASNIATYGEKSIHSAVSIKNVYVANAYTSANGEITLTCKDGDSNTVIVRTSYPLPKSDGSYATEEDFEYKTIDVLGVLDAYSGSYQIRLVSYNDATFITK